MKRQEKEVVYISDTLCKKPGMEFEFGTFPGGTGLLALQSEAVMASMGHCDPAITCTSYEMPKAFQLKRDNIVPDIIVGKK